MIYYLSFINFAPIKITININKSQIKPCVTTPVVKFMIGQTIIIYYLLFNHTILIIIYLIIKNVIDFLLIIKTTLVNIIHL